MLKQGRREKMEKKKEKSKEEIIEFLKNLPDGRKIFYQFGSIMVEVTRDEAVKLLGEGKEN
jgi:chaperonin cofactor prefoldin